MGRFGPTGAVEVRGLEHSVAELSWGVLRGAYGPSDGSAGARCNVPSALSVLRHAEIYLPFPEEIEDAFDVLEHHAIDHGRLYPVAIAIVPFVLDMLRRKSVLAERLADLLAEYAGATATPEPEIRARLRTILSDHAPEIVRWLGRLDRAAAALAIHVPALRPEMLAAIAAAERVAPELLLALVELDAAPGRTVELAIALLDGADSSDDARMSAAAFLAKHGDGTPALATRIDAALPPSAPAALRNFVGKLWTPTIERPVVAPKLYDAEVVFAGEKLVLVRAGARSVTLPWAGATVARGDRIKVGITAHGEPKLAVVTDDRGAVRVIDF
ncbi:MAG: hypothetical protein ACM31C_06160 [Acidobacteriota bacterium]